MDRRAPVIDIDLGTCSSSSEAVFQNGKVEVVAKGRGNRSTTPTSCVAFSSESARPLLPVGDDDTKKTQMGMGMNPANTFKGTQRLIGRKFKDPSVQKDMKKLWPFQVINNNGGKKPKEVSVGNKGEEGKKKKSWLFPKKISSNILANRMKETAEKQLGLGKRVTTDAVVTAVPAHFDALQSQQAIRDAGTRTSGGLNNMLRIVCGSLTAAAASAAVAHGLVDKGVRVQRNLERNLGGASLDVPVPVVANTEGDGVFGAHSRRPLSQYWIPGGLKRNNQSSSPSSRLFKNSHSYLCVSSSDSKKGVMSSVSSSSPISSTTSPTRVLPWKCKYCPLSFMRELSLVMHIEKVHEVERQRRLRVVRQTRRGRRRRDVKCDLCGQRCLNFESYNNHKLSHGSHHHPPMMKHVCCQHCGKLFQDQAHYKMHQRVHNMHVLPFNRNPDQCLETFDTEFDLGSHSHHGRRTESAEEMPSHSRRHGTSSEGEQVACGGGSSSALLLLEENQRRNDDLTNVNQSTPIEIKSEIVEENQGVAVASGTGHGQSDIETGFQKTVVDQKKLKIQSEPSPEAYPGVGVLGGPASPQDEHLTTTTTTLAQGSATPPPLDGSLTLCLNEDQMDSVTQPVTTPPIPKFEYQATPSGISITVDLLAEGKKSKPEEVSPTPHKVVVASSSASKSAGRAAFLMEPDTEGVVISHDEGFITFSGSKNDKGGTRIIEDVKLSYGRKPIPNLSLYVNNNNNNNNNTADFIADSQNGEDEVNLCS